MIVLVSMLLIVFGCTIVVWISSLISASSDWLKRPSLKLPILRLVGR